MDKNKIYLYILYVLAAMGILALASCASDELVGEGEATGGKMSLGVNVLQAQDASNTRAVLAPPIKNYQMKTDGKPVYVQMSSEAYIDRNNASCPNGAEFEDKKSRGVSITSDTFYERFGLFYYQYSKADSWAGIVSAGTESPTVSNFAVEKSAGWLTDKYWPGADHKLTFMAYAPYDNDYKNASGAKYIQLSSNIKGYPSLTYTVPDKVADQQDLLVSAEPGTQDMVGDYNKVIGMKFYHALSAINFKIGSTMAPGRIAKIEIKGVYNKGDYDFGTRAWTNQSGTADYSITPNYIVDQQRGVVFTGVDDSKNDLFLVMPQTVPEGAKIVVTIEDGANYGSSHEMELPIEGHEWLSGYTVTYSLSTAQENSDYIFSVSKIPSIDKAATTVDYKVTSYVQSYYGSQTPVGWTAKYAVDEGIDNEEYSTDYGDVVSGGYIFDMPTPSATTSSLQAKITELEPPVSDPAINDHTKTLRGKTEVGTAAHPYDLSMRNGKQNTANTYIVSAPGYYKIPLVYGNAMKDGQDNGVAYGKTSTTQVYFLNHLNKRITEPYLTDNADVIPVEPILVWQDAYKMIDTASLAITADKRYLCFKVDKDYICQGNALLSVRDENKKICWSWQIWVTDADISSSTDIAITNHVSSEYQLMAFPLGFCDVDTRSYRPREIEFYFEQEESGNTAFTTFNQTTTTVQEYGCNASFYQWGRNTPDRTVAGTDNKTFKTFYFGCSDYQLGKSGSAVTGGVAIQNPCTHYYTTSGDWRSPKRLVYLWDAASTKAEFFDKSSHHSVKTIYDPSPMGYKVPEPQAFTGATSTGTDQKSVANFNVSGTFDKGWHFFTQPGKTGSTYFFHALGYLYFDTVAPTVVNTEGYYWVCAFSPNTSNDQGFRFRFSKSAIYLTSANKSRRSYSKPVRPVIDD